MPIALVTFVAALVILLGEFVPDNRKTLRRFLVVGGGAATACAAVFAAYQQGKYEDRIESLSTATRNLVTGGDSYAWILVSRAADQEGRHGLVAVHGGDSMPAFDVTVRFEVTGRCDGFEHWTMGKIMSSGVNDPRFIRLNAVMPGMLHTVPVGVKPTCDDAYYEAFITTRNRVLFQQTLLRKKAGDWQVAVRLRDTATDRILYVDDPSAIATVWPDASELMNQLRDVLKKLKRGEVPQPPPLPGGES